MSIEESILQEAALVRLAESIIDVHDEDHARENANLNGESFSGKMSKLGSEFSKWYAKNVIMPKALVEAVDSNYVYVHDLDQYVLGTTNCIFIPFGKLLERGFNTGNGSVRPPNSITTAMALVAIIFQSQQNAQYGGVSANKLDWDLAPYINKSFRKHFRKALLVLQENAPYLSDDQLVFSNKGLQDTCPESYQHARKQTIEETNQAAEALIHNLNTMSSRAGGQIPFTSINYGTCTSEEGRLVIDALLNATIKGLGNGETPVFPIQIFKCKKGVNQAPEDPNYELFLKSIECSSKRLYPNFANIDAPINLAYYNPEDPDTEFATMGCRTRVIGDRFGRNRLSGKGNLSFNTINLVKLGIENGIALGKRQVADEAGFYTALEKCLDIAMMGLIHRYNIQAAQQAKASDFMMREGVWEGGEKLAATDSVADLLKHGSLSIGFIGIAECMKAMYGKHHAEDAEVHERALAMVRFMRSYCDAKAEEHDLNITLFATPAEGLSGKFTKIDRQTYGVIEGVTDRDYYTNSYHVPVYYHLKAAKKIQLEAPFHEPCNAGAISYIELDGNARNNQLAFLRIVQFALANDVSYFSVNHPIDRCPVCGYEGIIGSVCPNCNASEERHAFRRLRRVTGYLTGDYQTRFNMAKVAEVKDRVKHL
nr:anaerobic ribonucleoside triphosphate reductase [Paenibacillus oryzae]